MNTEKKVVSSDRFGSYGDRLRQKLINRLTCTTKNLTTIKRAVLKTNHTSSVSEINSATAVLSNRLSSEIQLNQIDDSRTEVAPADSQELLPPNEVDTETGEEKNFESYSLIWCDPNVNSDIDLKEAQIKLRCSIHFLKTFTTTTECTTYIQRRLGEKLILIVSGQLVQELLTQVHHLTQVKAIYTYASVKDASETLNKQFNKVNAVVEQPSDLFSLIASDQQNRIKNDEQEEMPMAIFNPLTVHSSAEQLHKSLDSEFMWFQLTIEILLRMTSRTLESGFKQLITMCRKHYCNNESDLSILNELEETYNIKNAIWWYSRETFIFRILNRALRRQDIDILVLFAFLIQHIYQQLKELQNCNSQIIHVYRGQLMYVGEFEQLKNSIGKYISMNTFFSTSCSRRLAKSFAKTYNTDTTKTSTLFEIEADSSLLSAKPFADITRISAFGNVEQEVLFMLGSIFKIMSIERIENEKLWLIKLVLSEDGENEMKPIFESMKTRLANQTTLFSLGNLFYEMGRPNAAEPYYRKLLKLLPKNDRSLSAVYGGLGNIALSNYDYQSADLYYRKALQLELESPTRSELFIASTYINLGINLRHQFNYEKALEYFNKSIELKIKITGHDHIEIARIYEEIGRVYQEQKKYFLALDNYNECLRIKRKMLPKNHLDIAVSFATLGTLQEEIGEEKSALINYKTALSIQLVCLPISPTTARMYETIGMFNEMKVGNNIEALKNYEKALETLQHPSLAPNHPNIALVLFRIGNIYIKQRDFELSKIKYEEALSIQLASTPNHINTVATYNSLGALHLFAYQNYDEALINFNKALRTCENTLVPLDNSEMIRAQVNIAKTYHLMGKFSDAKHYLEKTLKNLNENDPLIIEFTNQMGEIALERGEYDMAYSYFKQALDIPLNSSTDHSSLFADTYKNLGVVLMHKQSYDTSYEYLSNALDLKLKTVGHDNLSTASVYLECGNLYMRQKHYDLALSNYNECFRIQNEQLDENNLERTKTLRNIGIVHHTVKNYELALSSYNTVLSLQLSSYPTHPQTAKTYIVLAKLYLDAYSNISEALIYYQQALKIYENSTSLNNKLEMINLLNAIRSIYVHLANSAYQSANYDNAYSNFVKAVEYEQKKPSTFVDSSIMAELFRNLATVSLTQGNYDIALETYFKALELHLKTVGHDHLQTASIYGNIAFIQNIQRNYDAALTNSYECLEIRQKLLPNNHKDIAKALIHIGLVYKDTKNYESAINNYKKALSIQLESIPGDLETIKTYNHLGGIYTDCIPNYNEALIHFQEALKLCENSQLPLDHPEVIRIRQNIVLVYTKLGFEAYINNDYDNAIANYRKVIELQQESAEKNDASISKMYNWIGITLSLKHDYQGALGNYQKVLDLNLKNNGNRNESVADIYLNIGIVYLTLENYELAITNFVQYLEIQRKLFGESHPNIATALAGIGTAHYKRKDYELALMQHQHALTVRIECLPSNHLDVAVSYMSIGEVNEIGFENYIEALKNYEKALSIYRNLSLPSDDSGLTAALDCIRKVKEKMKID